MKKMTSRQLGGASDKEFIAETFEEIAEMSKKHAMEMIAKGDEGYLKKMEEMKEFAKDPEKMQKWFEDKRKEFESLPEIE